MDITARGKHVLLDFIGWNPEQSLSAADLLSLMRAVAEAAGVRILHEKLVEFDGSVSPEGFASVLLIDESHITAHCYSTQGLLAIDVFTCGDHDPEHIADELLIQFDKRAPELQCIERQSHLRFIERE